MATKKATMEYLVDQMRSLKGLRFRSMFGEYALYYNDKVVALVCDDELFVKITPDGKEYLGDEYKEGLPYPGAKPWIQVSGDLIENSDFVSRLIMITEKVLPAAEVKKKKSP
jgi:DNA transformation protein